MRNGGDSRNLKMSLTGRREAKRRGNNNEAKRAWRGRLEREVKPRAERNQPLRAHVCAGRRCDDQPAKTPRHSTRLNQSVIIQLSSTALQMGGGLSARKRGKMHTAANESQRNAPPVTRTALDAGPRRTSPVT